MFSDPLFVIGILTLNVAISEWLARHTPLRHLGSALLVIVLTAVAVNVGVIPTVASESVIYDGIFEYVGPLAIFWLLLQVHLRSVLRVGFPMLTLFLVGSAGTMLGVLVGMQVVGGERSFGDLHFALGGMFVGTYTGGSVNFGAIALELGVAREGLLFAGASVVDSAMTTVWMAVTVALPRLVACFWPRVRFGSSGTGAAATGSLITGIDQDTEMIHPFDLGRVVALGAFAVWISRHAGEWLEVPSILVLTTLALVLAQLGPIQRLKGTRLCGMFAVLMFLAVIGALCDLSALQQIGELGIQLTIFVSVVVAVHGLVVFGTAALLRFDPAMAAVASQANIGGGTSALALARSLGRADLVMPAILVGSLGTALGTYLGLFTASLLRS